MTEKDFIQNHPALIPREKPTELVMSDKNQVKSPKKKSGKTDRREKQTLSRLGQSLHDQTVLANNDSATRKLRFINRARRTLPNIFRKQNSKHDYSSKSVGKLRAKNNAHAKVKESKSSNALEFVQIRSQKILESEKMADYITVKTTPASQESSDGARRQDDMVPMASSMRKTRLDLNPTGNFQHPEYLISMSILLVTSNF